jgi:hypothetical protein
MKISSTKRKKEKKEEEHTDNKKNLLQIKRIKLARDKSKRVSHKDKEAQRRKRS